MSQYTTAGLIKELNNCDSKKQYVRYSILNIKLRDSLKKQETKNNNHRYSHHSIESQGSDIKEQGVREDQEDKLLEDHMKMWEEIDEERGVNKKVRMLQRLNRVLDPPAPKQDTSNSKSKPSNPVRVSKVILKKDGVSLSMQEKLQMI